MVLRKVCREKEIVWTMGRRKAFSGDSKRNVILETLGQLKQTILDDIHYYNERIHVKLKGLSP